MMDSADLGASPCPLWLPRMALGVLQRGQVSARLLCTTAGSSGLGLVSESRWCVYVSQGG